MKKKGIKALMSNKAIKTVICNRQLHQILGGDSINTGSGQPGQSATIIIRG